MFLYDDDAGYLVISIICSLTIYLHKQSLNQIDFCFIGPESDLSAWIKTRLFTQLCNVHFIDNIIWNN